MFLHFQTWNTKFPAAAFLQVSRNKACIFLSNLPFSDKMQTAEAIAHVTSQGITVTQNTTLKWMADDCIFHTTSLAEYKMSQSLLIYGRVVWSSQKYMRRSISNDPQLRIQLLDMVAKTTNSNKCMQIYEWLIHVRGILCL